MIGATLREKRSGRTFVVRAVDGGALLLVADDNGEQLRESAAGLTAYDVLSAGRGA